MAKNRFNKAMNREFNDEGTFNNINESIRLAKELKVNDVVDPTGKKMAIVAEIISRLKECDELEILEDHPIKIIGALA